MIWNADNFDFQYFNTFADSYIEMPLTITDGGNAWGKVFINDGVYADNFDDLPIFPYYVPSDIIDNYIIYGFYQQETLTNTPICALYVYLTVYDNPSQYYRVDYAESIIQDNTAVGGNILSNIFQFGVDISNHIKGVAERILSFEIGGITFFALITSGFVIYATWVIIKWVIP